MFGSIKLATTNTTNDSITLSVDESKTVWESTPFDTQSLGNTLVLWNQLDTTEDKILTLDQDVTLSNADILGTTKGQNVTISGNKTIDLNNQAGFNLLNNNFTISDATIKGNDTLITVNNSNVNLSNATLNGNIVSNDEYNLNISGTGTRTGTE